MISTLGIIIDLVIIALFVIFGLIGLKKGFLKSVLSLFSWGFCITIAFLTAKYVAICLNGLYDFSGLIGDKIANYLTKTNDFFSMTISEAGGKEALIQTSSKLNINSLLKQLIKVVFNNSKVDASSKETIGSIVGDSLGHICMVVISGILVFVILLIATKLLSKLFKNIEQIKIIGGLNKILGFILGILKATLIVGVVNCILVALSLIPPVNKAITPVIQDNSHVEKVIYNATDKLFEKYVIEGDMLKNWVENLWEKR